MNTHIPTPITTLNPIKRDDPFAPHNNPMKRDDPFAAWNNPFSHGKYEQEARDY